MPIFKSRVNTNSETYVKNRADMLSAIVALRNLERRAVTTSNKRRPVFEKRGQIPPHERLSRLLDPGLPFLQLHTLANYLVEDDNPETSVPGANLICGIGFVKGVRSMIWVDDSGIRAGSMTKTTMPTIISLQEIARRQKLPLIHLVESAGADLTTFLVESWAGSGGMFKNLARLSAAGIPTMVVLHGPSTAGGAYMPGMSDYVIGVKENGLAALAGAALVKAATGEVADERQLGGTEMHSTTSGLVEYLADDDTHGLEIARDIVGRLNWNSRANPPQRKSFTPPLYNPDELAGVVPKDYKESFDTREVMARLTDGSDFEEFKSRYGPATVCVQTSIMGYPCAMIGNNGPIDPQGATKAAQFFQLCDSANLPIIFLHNTTGYMVGTEYEQAGMIKHGAKMIQAVSNIRVPKISLYISASYGAGNYGMCGYAYEPDFLFSWPNSTSQVMGGEQASKTMGQIITAAAERRGEPVDQELIKREEKRIFDHFTKQESAFYTSGRVLDHGVIDPRDSRKVIGFALETCLEGRNRELQPNAFGVSRM